MKEEGAQKRRDGLLVEYQVLQKFRLEWSMIGHRWGYYLVPLCGAILWWSWNLGKENLSIGILLIIALLSFWRYMHHYFDDGVKKLYLRLVEIEEERGMEFTQRYLKREMKNSRLFNEKFRGAQKLSKYIRENQYSANIFGSRGLEKWDIGAWIAIVLLCLWFFVTTFPQYPLSVFVFLAPIFCAFYFDRKDIQD